MSEERFDRIENLLHLLIGSFGDFRDEMLEFKHQTNERFDKLESRTEKLERQLHVFQAQTNERFERLESRMGAFEARTIERFDKLENQMYAFQASNNDRFDMLTQSLHEVNKNVMYLMPLRALHGAQLPR